MTTGILQLAFGQEPFGGQFRLMFTPGDTKFTISASGVVAKNNTVFASLPFVSGGNMKPIGQIDGSGNLVSQDSTGKTVVDYSGVADTPLQAPFNQIRLAKNFGSPFGFYAGTYDVVVGIVQAPPQLPPGISALVQAVGNGTFSVGDGDYDDAISYTEAVPGFSNVKVTFGGPNSAALKLGTAQKIAQLMGGTVTNDLAPWLSPNSITPDSNKPLVPYLTLAGGKTIPAASVGYYIRFSPVSILTEVLQNEFFGI